ncbi:MAG: TRAP transporter small permease [Proteobacteria bacterium]|nr:TRAP transporter small permease [Pseudomonadota bacterium]
MNACKRLVLKIDVVLERVDSVFIILSAVALTGMFGLIFVEIISRKLFDTSIHIAMEYSEYGLAFIAMLALAGVTRGREHLQVGVLVDRLKENAQKVLHFVFSLVLFFAYNLFLTYLSYILFSESYHLGTKSQTVGHTPLWIPQVVVFIGLLSADIRILNDLLKAALGLSGDETDRTAEEGG